MYALAAIISGCNSKIDRINIQDYPPLQYIYRAPTQGLYSLKAGNLYTNDLNDFANRSWAEKHGLLLHEQYHAKREQYFGTVDYQRQYNNDLGFRALEEKTGWSLQLRSYKQNHVYVDVDLVANIFVKTYKIMDYDRAVAWITNEYNAE